MRAYSKEVHATFQVVSILFSFQKTLRSWEKFEKHICWHVGTVNYEKMGEASCHSILQMEIWARWWLIERRRAGGKNTGVCAAVVYVRLSQPSLSQ